MKSQPLIFLLFALAMSSVKCLHDEGMPHLNDEGMSTL